MDRDFDAHFEGEQGPSGEFQGKTCKIVNKTLSTRVGIGPVKEEIKCKTTRIILNSREDNLEM